MQYSVAASALVLAATTVYAQVPLTEPTTQAPAGCDRNYNGSFEITIVPTNGADPTVARRGLGQSSDVKHLSNMAKRQNAACLSQGTLVANLNNGVLTDAQGRTGSIVSNRQFQFDPEGGQAGAIYTGGFSVCSPSNHLALGDSTIFYQCASGDFYNLYDQAIAEQCHPVYIEVIPCDGSAMGMNGMATSTGTQLGDGQINSNANQIADGQVQNGINQVAGPPHQMCHEEMDKLIQPRWTIAGARCSADSSDTDNRNDGQVQNGGATNGGNANQIADGQVQNGGATYGGADNGGNANQIADGQVQNGDGANGGADNGGADNGGNGNGGNANQIADGQVQNGDGANGGADNGGADNGGNANQIADGQVQSPGFVNQIPDGQIQGQAPPTVTAAAQIADGQLQARQLEGPFQGGVDGREGGLRGEDILTATSSTTQTDAAMFTNAAVPKQAKRAFAGLAAAAAGYAAII